MSKNNITNTLKRNINREKSSNKFEKLINRITSNNIHILIILLITGLIVYGNVLNGPMFFDDEHFIQKNKHVHDFNIKKNYTKSVTDGANMPSNFYRPNQQIVFSILYQFAGENSFPYHLTSIILHILNAFIIFLLARNFNFSKTGGLIASMFFLLHPIQTEAVSYISGLADPLSVFFLLSGLYFLIKSNTYSNIKSELYNKIISIIFLILALFTKENMVIYLPLAVILLITYNILYNKNFINIYTKIYILSVVIIIVIYIYLKFTVFTFLDYEGLASHSNAYTQKLHIRIITFISIIWEYFKMLVCPVHLHYEKPYIAYSNWITWRAAFGYAIIGIFIFVLLKLKKYPHLFLSSSWFFVALIPFIGIVPLNAMYLEHWLYVPIIGISFLTAFLYDKIKNKKIFIIIILPLFLFYSIRVIIRNKEWADVEKFYLKELEYSKNALRIYNNLGLYYANIAEKHENDKQKFYKMNRKAETYYKKAIGIAEIYPQPYHNIGNIYYSEGRIQEAFNEYIFALSIDPNFIYSHLKLAEIYNKNGNTKMANIFIQFAQRAEAGEKINFSEIQLSLVNN